MNSKLLFASLCTMLAATTIGVPDGYADHGVRIAKKKKISISKKLKQKGFGALPDSSDLAAKGGKKKKSSSLGALANAPTIPEIPESDIENLFWRDGVIERLIAGNPTPDDCNEFFNSSTNNQSGGMLACYGTSESGRTFEQLQQSATSICYLRSVPEASSGIELVSGTLPAGGMSAIFAPPATGSRLVKVQISDPQFGTQEMFINIFAQSNSVAYRHIIYSCNGTETIDGEELSVSSSGLYRSSHLGTGEGEGGNAVGGRELEELIAHSFL